MADASDQTMLLLKALEHGESAATDALLPLVYDELRARAGVLIGKERRDHTLQRTALVHEAYLKLVKGQVSFKSRAHFFNAAALAMRRILVDHAARRAALKRGGERGRVSLDDLQVPASEGEMDWLELDEALRRLEAHSPRRYQVVMLRFFSGRTEMEIAQMLNISLMTVRRDWEAARMWLYRVMRTEK